MWSMIAASVVDLPEPVVPVSRIRPRSSSASSRITWGRPSSLDRLDPVGDHARDDRHRPALAEGVDAEAGQALDGVGEVDLVVGVELPQLLRVLVAQHRSAGPLGVLGVHRLVLLQRGQLPVDASSGREGTLRCRSEPSCSTMCEARPRARTLSCIIGAASAPLERRCGGLSARPAASSGPRRRAHRAERWDRRHARCSRR